MAEWPELTFITDGKSIGMRIGERRDAFCFAEPHFMEDAKRVLITTLSLRHGIPEDILERRPTIEDHVI